MVRAVLAYTVPGVSIAGEHEPADVGTVGRRLRAALNGAGYVWPVRAVQVGAYRVAGEGGRVARHRGAGAPGGGWLPWWAGWQQPAAVAVAVAAGQLEPVDVPAGPIVGEITSERVLVARGCRRPETRRRVAWSVAQRGLLEWDRGTAQLVAADGAAQRARAVQLAGLETMRDAGMTMAAICAATGLSEQRVRDLLAGRS